MTAFPRKAIADLVINEKQRIVAIKDEVWELNLDQIESGTGRILEKELTRVSELGPSTHPFSAGTVLYSKLRPYLNKVVVADDDGYSTTELVPLRCDPAQVLPEYLAYYLRSPEFLSFAHTVVSGAKMPRMVMSEFWRYEIPLPPIIEQRRIAAILDKADALRAKRREAIAKLDQLLQSVFLEMFGDPLNNPFNWPMYELGELLIEGPQNGIYKPAADYGTGTPILRIDGFRAGDVITVSPIKRVRLTDSEVIKYGLKEGDIVINRVNSPEHLGKPALIDVVVEPTVFESNMMRMSLAKQSVRPLYLLKYLVQQCVRDQIAKKRKDAINQSSINQGDVRSLKINLPPLALQEKFEKIHNKIIRLKAEANCNSALLDSLYQSIQHQAFSGTL